MPRASAKSWLRCTAATQVITRRCDCAGCQQLHPDAVLALLQRRVVLVATEDQLIVATAAFDGNVVRSVFVNPALQGQGIGRLLMIEIELRAREAGVTVLSVPSSLTAQAFYAKLGFHNVRDVYHGNERTLVMEKVLLSRHIATVSIVPR